MGRFKLKSQTYYNILDQHKNKVARAAKAEAYIKIVICIN